MKISNVEADARIEELKKMDGYEEVEAGFSGTKGDKSNKGKAKKDSPIGDTALGDSMASNAWVVHGKFTKSGMPILAGDPHLQTTAPSPLTIGELSWGT